MAKAMPRRVFAAFLVVWLLSASGVSADNQYDWWPSTYSLYKSSTTWRTTGDSLRASASMTWNSTHTGDMRHMEGHGYRFTHDVHDMNANLNATGRYSTQLPNPYYDRDRTASGRYDEGEITVESTTFPTANQYYQSHIEFSHWFQSSGSSPTWYWDSGSGVLAQTAQISAAGCPLVCDKWDAAQGLADKPMGDTSYASKSAPTTAALAESGLDEEGAVTLATVPGTLDAPFRSTQDASGQVRLLPDLDSGLKEYRVRADAAAKKIAAGGPSRGVLTFARPISLADLAELETLGVGVESVEAVTTNDHGPRWTMGAPADGQLDAWLEAAVADTGESLLGIVSADVVVDAAGLAAARSDDRVYVVDLSLELFGRRNKDAQDVVMNDVYWSLAGWVD